MAAVTRSSSMKLVMATTSIARVAGLDLGGRGDPVEPGHQQVHHDDVRAERGRGLERRRRRRRPRRRPRGRRAGRGSRASRGGPSRGRRRSGRGSGRVVMSRRARGPRAGRSRGRDPAPARPVAGPVGVVGSSASIGERRDRPSAGRRRRWRMSAAPRIASPPSDLDRGEALVEQAGRPARRRRPARTASGSRPASRRSSRIPVRNRIDGMAAANSPVKASSGRIDGSRSG